MQCATAPDRLKLLLAEAEAAALDDLPQLLASIKDILEQTLADSAMTSDNIATVKHTLDALLTRVTITALTQSVQNLEGQVEELLQTHTKSRHEALLGQLAYVIDDAVARFVYGDDYDFSSRLRDTQDDAVNFTPEQKARWARVCSFIDKQGLPLRRLIGLTGIVRRLQFAAAHGSEAEKAATSADQLTMWAKELLQPQQFRAFPDLLRAAQLFSENGQIMKGASAATLEQRIAAASQVGIELPTHAACLGGSNLQLVCLASSPGGPCQGVQHCLQIHAAHCSHATQNNHVLLPCYTGAPLGTHTCTSADTPAVVHGFVRVWELR